MNLTKQKGDTMNRLHYLLSKVAEEAAEVAQMAAKTQQFGLRERYQDQPENFVRLAEELSDLLTVFGMLTQESGVSFGVHCAQINPDKVDKVERYYRLACQNLDLCPEVAE